MDRRSSQILYYRLHAKDFLYIKGVIAESYPQDYAPVTALQPPADSAPIAAALRIVITETIESRNALPRWGLRGKKQQTHPW
jgi:hypothetical protein